MSMLQKQDFKTLTQLQALGADENSLLDDSFLYVKASNKNQLLQTVIQNLYSDIGRYGFVNLAETTFSFNDSTYVFTLTSVGAGWRYIRNGKINYITGNKTVTLPGTPPAAGKYFIYIDSDDGTLIQSTSPWTLLDTKVPVAIVLWNNALTPKYHTAEERHQALIDRRTHYYLHNSFGTRVLSGSTLSGYTVAPAGPADTDNTMSISQANIADEDLLLTLPAVADGNGTTNNYCVLYRNGASNYEWKETAVPFDFTAAGFINYDNAGTLTQGQNNKFYNYYLLYTNLNNNCHFMFLPGRAEFSSLKTAQAEDPSLFDFTGFGISECVIAYQITFSSSNSYSTKGKVRIAAEPRRINSNVSTPSISGSNIDHETLLNLLGGSPGQHYHLTAAEYAALGSGGGGGGGGLDWNTDSGAPLVVENGLKGYKFEVITNEDGPPKNVVFIPVPESYTAGRPAKLFVYIWSISTSGTQFIKTKTYLIRPGIDAMDSTTNLYSSTNSAAANTGFSKTPQKVELDLSSNVGVINSINLAAGQLLRVEMERGVDGDTDALRVLAAMAVTFN